MAESERNDELSEERTNVVRHLNEALSAEEMDDVNFHVRQALQLLGVE